MRSTDTYLKGDKRNRLWMW